IQLVCNPAKLVIFPDGALVLSVEQVGQIAGWAIAELSDFVVGIGFKDFSGSGVIGIEIGEAKLVGVCGQARWGIAEFFDTAIGIGPGAKASQAIVGAG